MTILKEAILPALQILGIKDTQEARVLMLAIGLQESRLIHRRQIGGPARGLWQFEKGGGVRGVLNHASSSAKARELCEARSVAPTSDAVYNTLEKDDILAAGFARLLLLTDPRALPKIGEVQKAWEYYERNWRPGKTHRSTWDDLYKQAAELAK